MVLAIMNRTRRKIIIPLDGHGSYRERHGDIPTAVAELTPSAVAHVPTAHMPPTAGMAEIFHVPLNMELITYVPLGRDLEAAIGYEIFNFFFTFLHKDIHEKVAVFNASGLLVDRHENPLNMLKVYSPNAHFEDLLLEGLTESETQIADHAYTAIYRLYGDEIRAANHSRSKQPFFNAVSFNIPCFFVPNPRKPEQYNCYLSEFLNSLSMVFAEQIAAGYTLEVHLFLCRHAEGDPYVERRSEVHVSSRVESLSAITHYYATQPGWAELVDQKGSVINVRLPPAQMSKIFRRRDISLAELPPAYLPPPPGAPAPAPDISRTILAHIRTFFTTNTAIKSDWSLHLATLRLENAVDEYARVKNPTTGHNLEQAIIHLSKEARTQGRLQIPPLCQRLLNHFFPRR